MRTAFPISPRPWRRRARRWVGLTLLLTVLAAVTGVALATPAAADPGHAEHAGQPVVVTQAVGPYVLRVRITPPGGGKGIVVLDVDAPERPPGAADIDVTAVRTDTGVRVFDGEATLAVDDPGPYSFRFPVDSAGLWELRLTASGDEGEGTATVPFTVLAPPPSAIDTALLVAICATGTAVVVLVVIMTTARAGRPRRRAGAGAAVTVLVGLSVVATLAVQVVLVPATARQGAPAGGDRPPVQLLMEETPSGTGPGQRLGFTLADGYTGRPVDDLVPHHEALVHLVVRDANGLLAHLHPARVAPGRFVVDLAPTTAGRHTALVEITRLGSGGQVLWAGFTVPGAPAPGTPDPELAGEHDVADGLSVTATATPQNAGRATSLRFRVARDGVPVDGIDPWLGMPGHLLVSGPTGSGVTDDNGPAVFGHVHAAGPMPVEGAPAPRHVGPDLSFTYSFPRPGRYEVWLQFLHGRTVRTVAGHLDVPPADDLREVTR